MRVKAEFGVAPRTSAFKFLLALIEILLVPGNRTCELVGPVRRHISEAYGNVALFKEVEKKRYICIALDHGQ